MRRLLFVSLLLSWFALLPASAARLVIVSVNDTHGQTLPYGDDDLLGGMARVATVVNQTRAAEPNTLFLHAGDSFEGTMFFNAGAGEFGLKLWEMMGCDAFTLGNHDFALGTTALATAITNSGLTYPILTSNADFTGVSQALDPLVIGNYTAGVQDPTPYVVKTMQNGLKVGIFGVTTSQTATLQPASTADGVQFFNAATTPSAFQIAQGIVNTLRTTENVDVVIALTHLGLDTGASSSTIEDDRKLATNVSGIDVIVGGHDHVVRPVPDVVNGTVIVSAAAYNRYAAMLDLNIAANGTVTVNSFELKSIDSTIAEDPTIATAIAGFKAQVEVQYPGAYTTPVARSHVFMNGAAAAESGIGNLVADAFQSVTSADLAFDVSGTLRFDGYRGQLYPADILKILSLDYNPTTKMTAPLKVVTVFGNVPNTSPFAPGQPLLKGVLELLMSDFLNNSIPEAGTKHFAGVTFVYDPTQPDFSRLTNIEIGGVPFDPLATYTAATSENVAKQIPLVDLLFQLTGLPNELSANTVTTTIEPWVALRGSLTTMNRVSCSQGRALGRARTLQADLGFESDCSIDIEPVMWQPGGSVTFSIDVSNFGMTASQPTTVEVFYEQSPADTIPNLISAGTANLPAVSAFSGGSPGRQRVSLTYAVPGSLAAGIYPLQVVITPDPSETQTGNNTIDINPPPRGDILAGHGAGQSQGSEVRIFDADGSQVSSFLPYGTGGFGVDVASGDIDGTPPGRDEALIAPGPGPIFGPQIRAFDAGTGTPLAKVNFYAYGTLRFGARVDSGDVDSDSMDEILTGAGNGNVFGPHIRGWNFDGTKLTAMNISFFAYKTLRYGVEPASGDVDGDGYDEILTAPGPGSIFGAQVRGFNYDGAAVSSISKLNFMASTTALYGARLAGGDMDGDHYDEMAVGLGPAAANAAEVHFYDFDGANVSSIATQTPFTTMYGAEVAPCDRDGLGWEEFLASMGPDPGATRADVVSYRTTLMDNTAITMPLTFTAYPDPYGANVHGGFFGY